MKSFVYYKNERLFLLAKATIRQLRSDGQRKLLFCYQIYLSSTQTQTKIKMGKVIIESDWIVPGFISGGPFNMFCITFMLCVTCLVNKLLQYNTRDRISGHRNFFLGDQN